VGCLVRYPPADVTSFNTALLLRLCTVSLLLHVRPSAVCSAVVRFAPHIGPPRLQTITMKISAAIALVAVGGASAYSVDRSSLRSLGQKSIGTNSARSHARSNDIKMEGECTWARRFDLFPVAPPPRPTHGLPDSDSSRRLLYHLPRNYNNNNINRENIKFQTSVSSRVQGTASRTCGGAARASRRPVSRHPSRRTACATA